MPMLAEGVSPRIARPPMRAGRRFHMVLPACPIAVRSTLSDAAQHCRRAGASADQVSTMELVLAEALNNVVEHAHADRADGIIEIELTLTATGADCRICDDGVAMPGGQLPAAERAGPCPVDLPEGGFGWPLIHGLTRDLRYVRRTGWNETAFTVPFDAPLQGLLC